MLVAIDELEPPQEAHASRKFPVWNDKRKLPRWYNKTNARRKIRMSMEACRRVRKWMV